MRLLLLGLTGAEPAFVAWAQWLDHAGVPFDAVSLRSVTEPLVIVDRDGHPRFQGVILAESGLIEVALEPAQRAALEQLESQLGLRRLTAYAVPGPDHGLCAASWSGPMDDMEPRLTPAGREAFPYLRGPLPVDPGSWAYLAEPVSADRFQILVAGAEQRALVGVHRHPDGREEMVQMFSANPAHAQGQILRRGQVAWLTRGTYLGHDRHYLSVHIDDVLMANHSWDVRAHRSNPGPEHSIRMRPQDARRAAGWCRRHGLRLDLACNGAGSSGYPAPSGPGADPLLAALLAERGAFGWVNHTYRHLNLDGASRAEIEAEIADNVRWAAEVGITLEPAALITGAHTGLANLAATPAQEENPHLAAALRAQGVRYVACDASRAYPLRDGGSPRPPLAPGLPFSVGEAFAIPRHPTILPHDAATPAQVLDRLRAEGAAGVSSFAQIIRREARRMFGLVISNDPRPHYFHQSNLVSAGDDSDPEAAPALAIALLDAVLDRYRTYVIDAVDLLQPTMGEIGDLLLRLQRWRALMADGQVGAYAQPGQVTVVNASAGAVDVPVTGTSAGEDYAFLSSEWVTVPPGTTVLES